MTTIITTKRGLRIAAAAALGAGLVQQTSAQNPSVTVEVGQCVDLPTPEQRLACFEAQVEAARTAPAPAGQSSQPSGAPGAAPTTTSTFGLPPDRAGREEKEEAPPDLYATVASLRETVPNAYLITLDNGQVWRQTQPAYYPLREGHVVRIYYSRWRSYRLTNEQLRGFIHVERVR